MHYSSEQLVQQIHDSPLRIVLAVAGGGSRAIADLVEVPGCSRTLLEAVVPYAAASMIAWLGGVPDHFCSSATARAMAMTAFYRAKKYEAADGIADGREPNPSAAPIAGVACAASLASDRPKRGPHRLHIALQTVAETAVWSLQLQKGRRTRTEEERLAGRLLLNVVAEAGGVADRLPLELLEGEQVEESRIKAPAAWQDLLLGKVESVRVGPTFSPANGLPSLLFPGTFNPLHAGHRRMIDVAQEMLQHPAVFELSILNVDKPALDYMEIERRLGQFAADQTVYLSRAATFEEKSRLFAGATFIVGSDTLRRIVSPQYHGGSESACSRAIEQIIARGCHFLVFGRDLGAGFARLGDIDLPDVLRAKCREVPPEVFREDISSSEIRKDANAQPR